jgi:hypothetical protein
MNEASNTTKAAMMPTTIGHRLGGAEDPLLLEIAMISRGTTKL